MGRVSFNGKMTHGIKGTLWEIFGMVTDCTSTREDSDRTVEGGIMVLKTMKGLFIMMAHLKTAMKANGIM